MQWLATAASLAGRFGPVLASSHAFIVIVDFKRVA
jgi:hypothetical protein